MNLHIPCFKWPKAKVDPGEGCFTMSFRWDFSSEKAPSAAAGPRQDGTRRSAGQGRLMEMGEKSRFRNTA